jgi:beta-lactamase class A
VNQPRTAISRRHRVTVSTSACVLFAASFVLWAPTPAGAQQRHGHRSLRQAIAAYVAHRKGAISVAVYDDVAKRLVVVRPKLRGRTASIVKVDILETLLHQTHGKLTPDQRATATAMIERSDNDAATKLWAEVGGKPGIRAYNDQAGLTETKPHQSKGPQPHWGLTTTSAADQVTLLRTLLRPNHLLTKSAQDFQQRLMRHVIPDQQWGISGGLPSDAKFGIKNGWLPVPQDHDRWAVNSMGWVRGEGKRYEITVLTQHESTEGYGIRTIEHIGKLAWEHAAAPHGGWGWGWG